MRQYNKPMSRAGCHENVRRLRLRPKKHTSAMYLLASKHDHAPSTTTQSQSPSQGQRLIYVKCWGAGWRAFSSSAMFVHVALVNGVPYITANEITQRHKEKLEQSDRWRRSSVYRLHPATS